MTKQRRPLVCILGLHSWPDEWKHDGKYNTSFAGRIRWCSRARCYVTQCSTPIMGGNYPGHNDQAREGRMVDG